MSIHRSLHGVTTLTRSRNVLSRRERIESLQKEGRWEEGENSIFGLPKVRTSFRTLTRKQKKAQQKALAEASGATEQEETTESSEKD